MKLAAELEASLREFASAGAAELCENSGGLGRCPSFPGKCAIRTIRR